MLPQQNCGYLTQVLAVLLSGRVLLATMSDAHIGAVCAAVPACSAAVLA